MKKRPQDPKGKTEHEPSTQEELNWSKIEKKAFRFKLLEICKTRTKKSSLDMLNFYLVSAAGRMVADNDSSTMCRSKIKAPSLKTVKQLKYLPKTWISPNKRLKSWDQKKSKTPVLARRTNQRNHKAAKSKTEHEPSSQEEINWCKIDKSIQIKLLELCKTRTKKSCPDLFNFYVVLAGHDMVLDAARATTCRRKFKAPWLQTKVQKMKDLPKINFTEKQFEDFRLKKILF